MTEPLNKDQVQTLLDDSPYIGFMNLEVVSMDLDKDEIVIKMPMRPEFERRLGPNARAGRAAGLLFIILKMKPGRSKNTGLPCDNDHVRRPGQTF